MRITRKYIPTKQVMPLSVAFFDEHYRDFYFFMSIVRNNMFFLSIDFLRGGDTGDTTLILSPANGKPEHLKKSRGFAKTWVNTFHYSKDVEVVYELKNCGFIAIIPYTLWDGFVADFGGEQVRSNELNSWCRLFFYLYWRTQSSHNFQSVHDMAAALGACTPDTSRRLIELEHRGWITRSSYSSQVGLSRVYGLGAKAQKLLASAAEASYNKVDKEEDHEPTID